MGIKSLMHRAKKGWNAFLNRNPTYPSGPGYSRRPDRMKFTRGNERSIVVAVFNRIAMDVAALNVVHSQQDAEGRFTGVVDSGLNNCLTLEANIDQTGSAFMQDVVMSMFDEGCVAIVPTHTDDEPKDGSGFGIDEMRTGKIVEWRPKSVKCEVYNEDTGKKEQIWCSKKTTAIVENPLYAVMNESNSTMARLIRKLNLLDVIDEQSSSGKLDMIIQVPFAIKTEKQREIAKQHKKDIEDQLRDSPFGIAYMDSTEHIVQLNRSLDNNLMNQVEYLTNQLYSQLGITQEILNGTASEEVMLNYNSRTIEPIISAIVDEMKRKFLTKTARSQHKSIEFFREPLKLTTVSQLAKVADVLIRDQIATANEIRQAIGWKPSTDPQADQLNNPNMPSDDSATVYDDTGYDETTENNSTDETNDISVEKDSGSLLDTPISQLET